ncbi:MAG TPA: ferritin-like domain-containing protein [Candidatus Baltobacteraceae bacterium]|jgi:bacterioferritin
MMLKRSSHKNGHKKSQPFLSDVRELRRRAQAAMEKGAVTSSYGLDPSEAVKVLQTALATEVVCVLRYTANAAAAMGINSSEVKAEFEEHANDELVHLRKIAERINELGGTPNLNPEGLLTRSHSQYSDGPELVDMIKENLIAERVAVESYTEMVRFFGDKDPTTRIMLEAILAQEEEHASDMHDLLVAREGRPMLRR